MNLQFIRGHVGADPDIHTFQDGEKVANFSVASTERWTDGNGDKREETEWHRVVVRGKNRIDNYVGKYIRKGSSVLVMGRTRSRTWTDNNGVERVTKEIVVGKFGHCELLDRAPSNSRAEPPPLERGDLDDEIPF